MVEFDCCECRRHIVDVIAERIPEPPLCATCLHIPGWQDDADLRRILGDAGSRTAGDAAG